MTTTGRGRGEVGETLVEVLVAVAILGLAAVAIMAGVGLSVKSSAIGRNQATGGSYVRSVAEAIQNFVAATSGNYQACATHNFYTGSATVGPSVDTYNAKAVFTLPHGYQIDQAPAQKWDASASPPQWTSCSGTPTLQRLDLMVTSTGDSSHRAVEKLTIIVRKPCNGPLPTPC